MSQTAVTDNPSAFLESLASIMAQGITKAALIEDRPAFEREARAQTLADWRTAQTTKVCAVGGLTGLAGGPVGLALEAGDLAYLFTMMGRACFGIGAIIGRRPVDYDADMALILPIWAGAAEATNEEALRAVGYKVGTKAAVQVGGTVGTQSLVKIGTKVVAKAAFKSGSKLAAKSFSKAAGKLGGKLAAKMSTKWVPLLGGVVSAGINYWIIKGVLDAAEQFYRGDVLLVDADLVEGV